MGRDAVRRGRYVECRDRAVSLGHIGDRPQAPRERLREAWSSQPNRRSREAGSARYERASRTHHRLKRWWELSGGSIRRRLLSIPVPAADPEEVESTHVDLRSAQTESRCTSVVPVDQSTKPVAP